MPKTDEPGPDTTRERVAGLVAVIIVAAIVVAAGVWFVFGVLFHSCGTQPCA